MNDPRVFFAAERTLLAWLRTGIAVIGLGFLVARFGLFLTLLRDQPTSQSSPQAAPSGSMFIGTGFVIAGALIIALAARQQARYLKTLSAEDLPPSYWSSFSVIVAWTLAGLGGALGLYLLLSLTA